MAVTWYTQSGTPSDSTGVDGDLAFDYAGRIQWGPKGLKTAGSWVNTAVNAVGPTGPGVLGGTGVPSSGLGQPGNVYVDAASANLYLKGASSWSLTGALPTSSATSFRHGFRGYWWSSGAPTAGTNYPVTMTIYSGGGPSTFALPISEYALAPGTLTGYSAFSPPGVGAGSLTLNILKNGTSVYTASSFITIGSTASTVGKVITQSAINFAAGDVLTATVSTSTTATNQSVGVNIFYTTNS